MYLLSPVTLGAHVAPSSEQALHIRDILSKKQADLLRLDLEVTRVQALLTQLIHDQDETRKYVQVHQAFLAPIRRIPLEILQEIFIHCLPSGRYIRPDALKAPLLLGQICVLWRRAALSTPPLWNSLAIQLSQRNYDRRIALMKSWLARSSERPISLFAYLPIADDDAINKFLQIFNSCLHRWKNLRLTLPLRCNNEVLNAFNRGTPLLERLEMRFSPIDWEDALPAAGRLNLTARSAPRLRSFSWSSHNFLRVIISLHTTQLTDINVDYSFSIPECLEVLRHCPKLVTCQFRAIGESATSPTDVPFSSPILLPDLHSLTLIATQPLETLFDHLTLPALHTLKVTDIGYENNDPRVWSQSRFTALLERSECALQYLHLLNVLTSEDELIQTLQWTTNSLVELWLLDLRGITVVMDRILRLLTARETTDGQIACLCPKLEVMKLGKCLSSSDGVLASMVESRWKFSSVGEGLLNQTRGRRVARLKSINPRLDSDHPDDIRRLASLREGGLKLL